MHRDLPRPPLRATPKALRCGRGSLLCMTGISPNQRTMRGRDWTRKGGRNWKRFDIDVAFALDGLGFPLAGGDPLGVDMAGDLHQPLGDGVRVGLTPNAPVFGWQGDEHARVAALDAQSEMEQRHLWGRLSWLLMGLLHTAPDQGENVVGQQCHSKAEQRGPRMAEAADFAVQHAFQALEHAFDAPASAI